MAIRITIITARRRTAKADVNDEIKWLCDSLGLFSMRDKESSCYRVFIELLKSAKEGKSLTSDELAYRLGLSRGTVMHHVNKLMEAGLVVPTRNMYSLREQNLEIMMEDLRRDVERAFQDLRSTAKKIDKELGI